MIDGECVGSIKRSAAYRNTIGCRHKRRELYYSLLILRNWVIPRNAFPFIRSFDEVKIEQNAFCLILIKRNNNETKKQTRNSLESNPLSELNPFKIWAKKRIQSGFFCRMVSSSTSRKKQNDKTKRHRKRGAENFFFLVFLSRRWSFVSLRRIELNGCDDASATAMHKKNPFRAMQPINIRHTVNPYAVFTTTMERVCDAWPKRAQQNALDSWESISGAAFTSYINLHVCRIFDGLKTMFSCRSIAWSAGTSGTYMHPRERCGLPVYRKKNILPKQWINLKKKSNATKTRIMYAIVPFIYFSIARILFAFECRQKKPRLHLTQLA